MKIWYDGEDTWYAAETRQEAIAETEKYNGPLDQDMKDEFRELTEKKMSDYRFYDEYPDENDETQSRTFKEQLEKNIKDGDKFPCIFAGRE